MVVQVKLNLKQKKILEIQISKLRKKGKQKKILDRLISSL